MTIKDIEKNYGVCGLVCSLCSCNENCAGCRCKDEDCDIKACCTRKGLGHCFECADWPCEKDMHKGIRLRAFNSVARDEGLHKLAEYLYTNFNRGITYHRADKLPGDYDKCKTEQEVIELVKNGKPNPYDVCPTYESKNFFLRLVSSDDAEDLLECYKSPTISVQANSENCNFGYGSQTPQDMRDCILQWLEAYKNRWFVRFSIIDRHRNKAVGTIEIFCDDRNGYSVLRVDISEDYETEEHLNELFNTAGAFFYDFGCKKIVTKAIPEATARISALVHNGYTPYPANDAWEREDYYIKYNV